MTTNDKVRKAVHSQPWAILEDQLHLIVDIADRLAADVPAALAKRESRGDPARARRERTTAVIPVYGPIFPRAELFTQLSGGVSAAGLSAMLADAAADPEVDAIVFDFDSPGGQITGIHELANRIRTAAAVKPVTAYISGMAASAAYWLACACGEIVADRTASVGSIGVIMSWSDDREARKAKGIRDYDIISSQSPNKRLDPATPEGQRAIQERVDALGEIFIGEVARLRGTAPERVEADFGRGATVLAEPALKLGMIDRVGGLETALGGGTGVSAALTMEGTTMNIPKTTAASGDGKTGKNDDDDDKKPEKDPSGEDKPKDDEEDPEDKDGKDKGFASAAEAFAAGAAQERARIKAILDMNFVGQDDLITRALFTEPMSVEQLSYAYHKAETKARADTLAGRRQDTTALGSIPSAPAADNQDDALRQRLVAAAVAAKK